jgi:dihydropteroate synthase
LEIKGKKAIDVYSTISKLKLVSLYEHASYLGDELRKAELAIKHDLNYIQDMELRLKK